MNQPVHAVEPTAPADPIKAYAAQLVNAWPELSQWQRDRLGVLLRHTSRSNGDDCNAAQPA